jgi:maltooligosyltrehalose trehalohydrolase
LIPSQPEGLFVVTKTLPRQDFGPIFNRDGTITFRVWAPACNTLSIAIADSGTRLPMMRDANGMFTVNAKVGADTKYWVELANGERRPDPASRFQPEGVHGPSQLVDTNQFKWEQTDWRGCPKEDLIIYELHLGTFTQAGDYRSAMDRLHEIVDLGATAIELMPLAQSAGLRNWGYDGVNLFAPHHAYGTPDELRQFIDAAHRLNLAVILDVVYNHFGPEGNYLREFGGYISHQHRTPWGDAPDFEGDGPVSMKDFVIANASYWLKEYRLDGLRLDAVHCMIDTSVPHVVTEIGQAVQALRDEVKRPIHLIGESNIYDHHLLMPLDQGGHGFDSIWCDDFLHSVFAVLRPGEHMSQRQYITHRDLETVLHRGFVFQGGLNGQRERVPTNAVAPKASFESLIFSIQNHDFIGNHPNAARLHQLTSRDALRAAASLLLLSPAIPMLFMGEEFASENPFYFFVDFGDETLRRAVEEGRRREYPQHDWKHADSPLSEAAFRKSYIGSRDEGNRETLEWYKWLIHFRKSLLASNKLGPSMVAATWDEDNHLAVLEFGSNGESAFLLTRLHAEETHVTSVAVHVNGVVLKSQQSVVSEHANHQVILKRHGVVIGRGTARVI